VAKVKRFMTPTQMRMARAALQLTVRDIETKAGVNKNTISRYESGRDILASALQKLEKLFRDEGVIFLEEDTSGGQGLRLAKTDIVPVRRDLRVTARAKIAKSEKRSQKSK
jgi:transcriptional regulator with XRE-family HTH domain